MEKIIRNWFSDHPITVLNVIVVSIMNNINNTGNINVGYLRVLRQLLTDGKIDQGIYNNLKSDYNKLNDLKMVNEFITIIYDVANNPNLIIPGVWVPDNTIGRMKNRCFPCRSKSNPS